MERDQVIWGSYWDPLLTNDKTGHLVKTMNETVDGEYQAMKARDGAYVREKFSGNILKQKNWSQVYQTRIFGG